MYNNRNMHQYRAYAAANMTVGKTRQVVMLYDGAIRFVQQAVEAIDREDYEARYNLLTKTSEIIVGLQSSLDFENGGEIAKLLYDFYASLDARIFSVHRNNSVPTLESVAKELRMMRDAWHEIDRQQAEEAAKSHIVEGAPIHPGQNASFNSASVSA